MYSSMPHGPMEYDWRVAGVLMKAEMQLILSCITQVEAASVSVGDMRRELEARQRRVRNTAQCFPASIYSLHVQ